MELKEMIKVIKKLKKLPPTRKIIWGETGAGTSDLKLPVGTTAGVALAKIETLFRDLSIELGIKEV